MFAKITEGLLALQQKGLQSPAGQYWLQLAPREQKLLSFLAVFVLIFALYSLIWEPIQKQNKEAQQRLQLAESQWQWLNEQIPAWEKSAYANKSAGQPPKSAFSDHNQLMAFVNQQLSVFKTQSALKEMKSNAKGVKITLKAANAVKVFKWLQAIEAKGVQIESLKLEQQSPGIIDVQMSLVL